ncbi:hypothetical protein Lal_00003056 [Lupinus albus]|nr:hypothetical protein Lal_00003056 [Lupinus albus]
MTDCYRCQQIIFPLNYEHKAKIQAITSGSRDEKIIKPQIDAYRIFHFPCRIKKPFSLTMTRFTSASAFRHTISSHNADTAYFIGVLQKVKQHLSESACPRA